MRVVASVVLLVALFAGAALGSSVVDATDATFDQVIASAEVVLMEFYAPWCGHCKKLEPEYTKAAQQIDATKAVLAKLDATVESKSAAKFEVKGYPTIKVFRNGALAGDYNGGRTAADLVKWVAANTGPAVTTVANSVELETLKTQHSVLAVFFTTSIGSDKFEAFETVAKSLRESFTFAVVTDSALFDGEDNTLVVYKHFDDKKEVFAGAAFDAASITAFVSNAGVPLFDEIGPHNYKMYMDRKLPIAWLFATAADTAALDAGRATAPSFKGKVSFVWIDSSKYAGMAQRVGLKGDKFPAFVINDDSQKRFVYPEGEAITDAELLSFVTKYADGSLTATLRSDPAPQPHTVDGLTTVVGSTFNELVAEADTDVLIEFYAPWCGHCKQLAPVYEAVAKTLQDAPVRIAKIDATTNDFDQAKFPVQGFPTLFFVPKSTHVPVPYEGARTEEALLKFLESAKA